MLYGCNFLVALEITAQPSLISRHRRHCVSLKLAEVTQYTHLTSAFTVSRVFLSSRHLHNAAFLAWLISRALIVLSKCTRRYWEY